MLTCCKNTIVFQKACCSGKHLLKMFAFVLYLLQLYHVLKEKELMEFFVITKRFKNRSVGFSSNSWVILLFPKVFIAGCLGN